MGSIAWWCFLNFSWYVTWAESLGTWGPCGRRFHYRKLLRMVSVAYQNSYLSIHLLTFLWRVSRSRDWFFDKSSEIKGHGKKFFKRSILLTLFSTFFVFINFLVELITSSEKLAKFEVLMMKRVFVGFKKNICRFEKNMFCFLFLTHRKKLLTLFLKNKWLITVRIFKLLAEQVCCAVDFPQKNRSS